MPAIRPTRTLAPTSRMLEGRIQEPGYTLALPCGGGGMADALVSGASVRKDVEVQLRGSAAPTPLMEAYAHFRLDRRAAATVGVSDLAARWPRGGEPGTTGWDGVRETTPCGAYAHSCADAQRYTGNLEPKRVSGGSIARPVPHRGQAGTGVDRRLCDGGPGPLTEDRQNQRPAPSAWSSVSQGPPILALWQSQPLSHGWLRPNLAFGFR